MSENDAASGQGGYAGQQGIPDGASPFNVMTAIIAGALGRVRTMALVKVVAVTNEGGLSPVGFVDVLPLVKQVDGVGNATPHGTIFNLPYFRLQGGSNAVIMDPQVDDVGIAVVADRDSSSVKSTKAEATPGSKRRFSLADGVYVGGILNGAPEQYVRFTDDGMILADKNGNVLSMESGKIAATTTVFEIDGALHVTGQSTFDGAAAFAAISAASLAITGAITAATLALSGALTAASAAIVGAITAATSTFTGRMTSNTATITGVLTGPTDIIFTGKASYDSHQHGGVQSGGAFTGVPT